MKKTILALSMTVLLAACGGAGRERPDLGVAPPVQMPALPDNLNQRAERLPDITDGTIGGLTRDGVNTDQRYNDLAHRHNAVLRAYECVRTAVNARDASLLAPCFSGDRPNATPEAQPEQTN